MRITLALLLAALLAIPAAAGNGTGMNAEEAEELMMSPLKDKSPDELARYFAHPNGYMCRFVVKAIVDQHGKSAAPAMERLLDDSNPWVRHGAVSTLTAIYLPKRPRGSQAEPRELTPQLERLMKLVEPLADDKHPAVTQAMVALSTELGVETKATRQVAIEMAGNSDIAVRTKALDIGRNVVTDPATHIEIGMRVSVFPNNIPTVWGDAHQLIAQHKDEKACRRAIPTLANFLLHIANTRPVRGMFSGTPQSVALATIDAQWDAEVEQMKDVVPAICCVFVRVPESWMDVRKSSLDLLKKMSPVAAPAIRQFVANERKWLEEVEDTEVQKFERDPTKGRALFTSAVDYLEYIAGCLESGTKITRECPIQLEVKKLYQDKVSDPNELDLDDLFD